ncbi:hypothetical protein LTR53_018832, partial [Teratosphaeriaceae sp. CCFEE 6253]
AVNGTPGAKVAGAGAGLVGRKRHDTITGAESAALLSSSSGSDRGRDDTAGAARAARPVAPGDKTKTPLDGTPQLDAGKVSGVKRKAEDSPPEPGPAKHRKTASASAASLSRPALASTNGTAPNPSRTARPSPEAPLDPSTASSDSALSLVDTGSSSTATSSSDSAASVLDTITYAQGVA